MSSTCAGTRANASALEAPGPAPSSEGFEPSTPSSPAGLCSDPAVMELVSTSRTRWTNSASSRSSRRDSTRVGMPMAPIANCAARDSRTRSRSSAAAERRSVARTPSLMRSRRGCGAGGRWAGARGIRQGVSFGARVPSSAASRGGARGRDLEGRGEETAADRVAYLGAAVVELAVVLAVAEDDGAGDVAHGASHALRVPGPAGDAISVRQIRGRGGYGARARCVARGRGEGGRGRYARVPSRLFPTSRTSRSPRLAVRARAMVRPPRATRNGSLSTTRGSIGRTSLLSAKPSVRRL